MSMTARYARLIGVGLVAVVATSVLSPVEASAAGTKTVTQKVSVTQKATVSQKATMSATVDGVTRRATRTAKHTASARATVAKKARATTATKARSKARSAARKAATTKARKQAVARARSGATTKARSAASAAARQEAQRTATQLARAAVPTSYTVTDTQTVEQTVTVKETFVVEGHTGHGEATATASATVTKTETQPTQWEASYWATWNAYWEATAQAAAEAEAKARPIALERAEEDARAKLAAAAKPQTYTAVATVEQTVTVSQTHTIGDVVGRGEATASASATVTHTEEAAELWEAYYWATVRAHEMATEQAKADATAKATEQAKAAAVADAEAQVAAQTPPPPAEPTDPGAPTGPTDPSDTVPPADGDDCGPTLRKQDGSAWECTLVEDFDGTSLDRSLWVPQRTDVTGWNNSEECVVDDPEHLEVSDGTLKIHTRKAAAPFTCKSPFGDFTAEYKTASISTWSKFTQAYGRFEFRAKMPDVKVQGIHSALWMWPENDQKYGPWPHSGEIDIAEFYSLYPDRSIPMLHYNGPMEGLSGAPDSGRTNYWCTYDPSQWTTYVAEWTTWGITISYGDQVCLRHQWNPLAPLTGSQPFDQPFMLAISQGLGLQGNARTAETPALATLEVDWVKVWK